MVRQPYLLKQKVLVIGIQKKVVKILQNLAKTCNLNIWRLEANLIETNELLGLS